VHRQVLFPFFHFFLNAPSSFLKFPIFSVQRQVFFHFSINLNVPSRYIHFFECAVKLPPIFSSAADFLSCQWFDPAGVQPWIFPGSAAC